MRFRLNYSKIGPLRFNWSMKRLREHGNPLSSVNLDMGAPTFRVWSAHSKTGLASIDTPGLGSIHFDLPSKGAPAAPTTHHAPWVATPPAPPTRQAQAGPAPWAYDPRTGIEFGPKGH